MVFIIEHKMSIQSDGGLNSFSSTSNSNTKIQLNFRYNRNNVTPIIRSIFYGTCCLEGSQIASTMLKSSGVNGNVGTIYLVKIMKQNPDTIV